MTKEERKVYGRNRYIANKSIFKLQAKERRESLRQDFYTLYYLKEENYIGVTNQPKLRLGQHKRNKRHVLDYEAVSTFKTKEEALNAERYMHSIGYNGGSRYFFNNFY
tara:strand:- start:54 stop:377 length:324 start_codon:yes stop_codon:yes gene_type:complete